MRKEGLDEFDVDVGFAQSLEVGAGNAAIGDGLMDGGDGHDERQAAAAEFGGVGDDDGATRRFGHGAIDAGFELIGRGEAVRDVKAIDSEEKHIGAEFAERILGQRSDERKGIFAQRAAGEDHFDAAVGQFCGDIGGVGDDGQIFEMAAAAGDGGGGGAGVEDDDLAGTNHVHGGGSDAKFLLAVQALFFVEGLILNGAGADGESAAVSALEHALSMEGFEVFADGNERGAKALGEIADEDTTIVLEQFENFAATLFAEHGRSFPAENGETHFLKVSIGGQAGGSERFRNLRGLAGLRYRALVTGRETASRTMTSKGWSSRTKRRSTRQLVGRDWL